MVTVTVEEAQNNFPGVLGRALQGEEVMIEKEGRPLALLTPVGMRSHRRTPGSARGRVTIAPDFDAPLPQEPGGVVPLAKLTAC